MSKKYAIAAMAFGCLMGLKTGSAQTPWNSSGNHIYNTNTGNVGIGLSNPSFKLDVLGITGLKGNLYLQGDNDNNDSNTPSPDLIFQGAGYAGATRLYAPREETYGRRGFAIATHSDPSDTRNLTERFRITYDGRIGIGTATPADKLHIDPNGTGGLIIGRNTSSGSYTGFTMGISSLQNGYAWMQSIKASGSEYGNLVINSGGGNVSIGTTDPGAYKLAVNGTIGTKKVVVTQTGWADYVFDSSYKLMSLPEVAAFIKTNKHLPEIPSAKKIESNGLDLAETQRLMMQKIEELTLYLIEQNKKSEEQLKKIAVLEQEVLLLKQQKQ